MPTVICPNNMCIYNDDFKGICTYEGCIHAEEECEAFTSYWERFTQSDGYCHKASKKMDTEVNGDA